MVYQLHILLFSLFANITMGFNFIVAYFSLMGENTKKYN